jgi:hypothetical protein
VFFSKKAPIIMKTRKLNLALIAVLLGTGFVFATNNPLKQSQRYYFYDSEWHDTPPAPGSAQCQTNLNKICSGEFESMPETTTNDVSANPGATLIVRGNYQ